jgi:basic membrane lipoprotein Med (substrate-binding protein (PBP1-ABC) superfamily)
LKGLDVAVSTAIQNVAEGSFEAGPRLYTIAEDGVGLGQIASGVDAELVSQIDEIRAGLQDGSIVPADQATS